jgi:hypothetical protein
MALPRAEAMERQHDFCRDTDPRLCQQRHRKDATRHSPGGLRPTLAHSSPVSSTGTWPNEVRADDNRPTPETSSHARPRSRGSTVEDQISPEFNATRIASASTTEHWTDKLKHALSGMPTAYIVVDLNLLDQADDLFTSIMRLIEICIPIKLKIAIINRRRLPRADYKSSSTAVLDGDQTTSSGPRAFVGQTRPGAGMGRGGGRGALAFRARLT